MDLQLRNRLALVTGSTAGIGYAIAESLAREGARVIVNGRTEDAVERAVARVKEATSGAVLGFAGDLSDAAAAERLSERFPDVEILVNNLGIFEPKPFEEIPDADWRRLFEVNVLSGVRLARLYLPAMRRMSVAMKSTSCPAPRFLPKAPVKWPVKRRWATTRSPATINCRISQRKSGTAARKPLEAKAGPSGPWGRPFGSVRSVNPGAIAAARYLPSPVFQKA